MENRQRRERRKRLIFKMHDIEHTFRAMRESHNYYRKRRLKVYAIVLFQKCRSLFLFPRLFLVVFSRQNCESEPRMFAKMMNLIRSLARSTIIARLETERLSGKGRTLDKKRIIAIVDKRYRRVRPCDFCD